MEKKKKPAIRFKGFTDSWEQRKLGDEAEEILAGGDIDKEKAVDDGVYPIYANALTNDGIVGYYDDYYRVKAPAVTVTGRGEVGHAQARMVDFTPVVRLLAIRSNHDCYFLENAINNHKVIVESTGVPQLTVPQLSSYDFCFPKDIMEEKKIGTYFNQLDHLITLHQRKYDKLQIIKKSMLEKIFPQSGSCFPEIRFKGFTDSWEQRKLGDLITEYKETVDSSCTLPVLTSSKTEGVILQEEHFGRKQQHDITGYNVLPRSYCTYRNRSDGVDFTFNVNECCDMGIISKFYPVFCGNDNDTYFLSLVLNNSDEVVHEIAYTCTGTGQKVLSFLDLQKMSIRVPRHDEQKRISAYFKQLDHLITLHQREVEKLQNIKKSMLKTMFV